MNAQEKLKEICTDLDRGRTRFVPVRDILAWFGASRRGYWVVEQIRRAFQVEGLKTNPDFEFVWIDSLVEFVKESTLSNNLEQQPISSSEVDKPSSDINADEIDKPSSDINADPAQRISKLSAANRKPLSIRPTALLREAISQMLINNYSQLPVMTNERDVKGIITWESIGSRLALGHTGNTVSDFMEHEHKEIRQDASLFSAISIIIESQYVLIRGSSMEIAGIVTASDLTQQFRQLTEPFLLIGEIENQIRRIIRDKIKEDALLDFVNQTLGVDRSVSSIKDFNFGEYIRLIENKEMWEQLKLAIDKTILTSKLQKVREIRNDVMHFDPDGVVEEDIIILRNVANFLQKLQ